MGDNKPIMDQLHEYENLFANVLNEGMKFCDIFQANVLLVKFLPSWTNYRHHLKHKKHYLILQELISHMQTEEANRLKEKMISFPSFNANSKESGSSADKRKSRVLNKGLLRKDKHNSNYLTKGDKKKPNQFNYFVCGNPGHKVYQCYKRQVPKSLVSNLL